MKKCNVLFGVIALCILTFFVFTFAGAAEVKIRLASSFEPKHILCQAADQFKKLVEERSKGAIIVELFLGGVMGSEEECTESVCIGAAEMQAGGGLPIKTFAPQYYFLDSPYVIKDWPHFKRVFLNSPVGNKAREIIAEKGRTIYLGVVYRGVRQFTSNKPIRTPADLQGLKLRLPQLPTWVAVWKEIGALPVPVALPELFSALQTGVADASEGDISQIHSFHLFEVQKYLSLTGHLVQTGALTINKAFFEKLSKENQEIVAKAANESGEWASQKILTGENDLIEDLKKKGMQVIAADAAAFREKAKPSVERLFKTEWPVTTWEEVLSF